MNKVFVFIASYFLLAPSAQAASWRVDGIDTLIMSGKIGGREADNVRPLWTDKIRQIIVEDSENAILDLDLGKFLAEKSYLLVIRGFCSQACVENLLLPAANVRFENGCIAVSEAARDLTDAEQLLTLDGKPVSRSSEEAVRRSVHDWHVYQDRMLARHERNAGFYADPTLSSEGLAYFPSALVLWKAGFTSIEGEPDRACAAKSGVHAYYYR